MFGLFEEKEKKFPRLKLDMFDPLDQPITVETGKELVSNFLLEIGYARDKEKAKWFAMEFVEELKKDFRVVKKSFELERKEGKKCKLEVERIEKEIIELKDKKLKLTDEDEIEEIRDYDEGKEVFQWYLIGSNHLFEFLRGNDEVVAETDYGNYWGRTSYGLAITMTPIFDKYWDMYGSKNR